MTGSYRTASAQLSEGRNEEGVQENSGFSNLLLSSECFYNNKNKIRKCNFKSISIFECHPLPN